MKRSARHRNMSGISFYSHQKEVFSRRSIRKRTGMKKIYLAYLLLIILSACGSKNTNSVYLNGEIKGLGNDTLYIYGTDKFYNRMDTLLVKDDKFSATLTTDTLASTWLQFSDGTEYPLYLDKGDNIKIKGSAAELTSLEITGNVPNEELTAFQKELKGLSTPSEKALGRKSRSLHQQPSFFTGKYLSAGEIFRDKNRNRTSP